MAKTCIGRNVESEPIMQSTTCGHLHSYRNPSGLSSSRGSFWTFILESLLSWLSNKLAHCLCLLVLLFRRKTDLISPGLSLVPVGLGISWFHQEHIVLGRIQRDSGDIHTQDSFLLLATVFYWKVSWFLAIGLSRRQLPLEMSTSSFPRSL